MCQGRHCPPLETSRQGERCSPLDSLCQQGCYSPLLDDPEPKGLCPSGHLACPCSGYPSCSCTMDTLLLEQVKQAQRFARIVGIFLCLFCSAAAGKVNKKPCRAINWNNRFSHQDAKIYCSKLLYLIYYKRQIF